MWPLLSILPLSVLVVSDVRSRSISLWWLLAFTVTLWVGLVVSDGFRTVLMRAAGGVVVILMLAAGLSAYSLIRRRSLSSMMGLGDVFFAVALAPALGARPYAVFLICSCVLSLLLWPLFRRFQPDLTGIPLVAVSGICFVFFMAAPFLGLRYAL